MSQRHLPLLALLLTLGLLVACGGDDADTATESTATASDLDPTALGSLGARIHASPDDTEQILADAGFDYPTFEKAVRDVAASVEASRRYRESFQATRKDLEARPDAATDADVPEPDETT